MAYKFTILIENTAVGGLAAEHGFSALLEGGGRQLLFDCGHTGAFIDNAAALGVALRPDAVVLSHNHYDHAGGLLRLLNEQSEFELYYSGDFFKSCYWIDTETGARNDTQSEVTRELLLGYAGLKQRPVTASLTPVEGFNGLYILSNFKRLDFEPVDQSNFAVRGGKTGVDDYLDEIALAISGADGITVISGCAHCGAAGICQAAERLLGVGVRRFYGGTHLVAYDEQRAQDTARFFETNEFLEVGACHCTGEMGAAALSALSCYKKVGAGFSTLIP